MLTNKNSLDLKRYFSFYGRKGHSWSVRDTEVFFLFIFRDPMVQRDANIKLLKSLHWCGFQSRTRYNTTGQ